MIGSEGPQGPPGVNGAQGIPGMDGASIIFGNGLPDNNNGKIGDIYLDISTSLLYGPKNSQGWGSSSLNLKGADGVNGKDGINGSDGNDGLAGANGKDGANGTNGNDGASFLSGNGAPASDLGKEGDFYLDIQNALIYGPKTASGWGKPVNLKATALAGKKLVTIGDSMTSESTWQPYLVEATGLVWSFYETSKGMIGSPMMGIGGATIRPVLLDDGKGNYIPGKGPGQSVYARATSVKNYNPDIIILWGGQNDSKPDANFDIYEAPYNGGEISGSASSVPTFVASYKGTLEILIKDNPKAKIYAMTVMYNGLIGGPNQINYERAESYNRIIREVCKMYSVEVIDLFSEVGITPLNASLYLRDAVHPNREGGKKIADLILSKIL